MSIQNISLARVTLTGAFSTLFLFVLCWLGAVLINLPATHAFIGLFTSYELLSVSALAAGALSSFVWGAVTGATIGFTYNLFRFVNKKEVADRS